MQTEPGTLALGTGGTLSLTIAEESYRLTRDDIHTLLFYGQSVPLSRTEERACSTPRSPPFTTASSPASSPTNRLDSAAVMITTVIDGHITVHPSGRAVLLVTRAGYFAIPLVSFQQVARGEAVSAPLFPVMPDTTGGLA
jgi:hypothetical protein